MTPRKKAEEIYLSFIKIGTVNMEDAKKCSLLCLMYLKQNATEQSFHDFFNEAQSEITNINQ